MTHRGVHQCGRSVLVMDSFHPYSVLVCLEWCFMYVRPISRGQNCEKPLFRPFFDKILAFNPPWCPEKGLPPVLLYFFKLYYTHFKNKFDFCSFFMIILVRKPQNVQNLAKMRKFKFLAPTGKWEAL